MFEPRPRTLGDPSELARRKAMLATVAEVQELEDWRRKYEDSRRRLVGQANCPSFDPAEAGVEARVLFVQDKPGSKAADRTGFISVDNPDPGAEHVWNVRNDLGLHEGFVHWNLVPHYLGSGSADPDEGDIRAGIKAFNSLLREVDWTKLEVIVLSGGFARNNLREILKEKHADCKVLEAPSPGRRAMNNPKLAAEFEDALAKVKDYLGL